MKLPWRKKGSLPSHAQVELWVSCDGIQPVGVIQGITDGEVTYLTDLYVTPEYRGQGRGTALMRRFLKAVGSTTIIVITQEAAAFYHKFGFVERTAMVRRADVGI